MHSVNRPRTIANLLDTRTFEQGEIYVVKDELVSIPDADVQGRHLHFRRPVIILHDTPLNSQSTFPTVMVAPLSHEVGYKKTCDLELHPEEGSVTGTSLLRLGLAQPMLKVDLVGPRGKLTDSQIKNMLTMQAFLHGII